MNRTLPFLAVACLLLPAGCFSSSAPAPAVRWFDPLASARDAAPAGERAKDAVAAIVARADVVPSTFLDREIALRVGDDELAFDDDHRWLRAPHELVAEALLRCGVGANSSDGVTVHVVAFEFDLRDGPQARVRLAVHRGGDPVGDANATVAAERPGVDALVRAAGDALARAAEDVRKQLTGR